MERHLMSPPPPWQFVFRQSKHAWEKISPRFFSGFLARLRRICLSVVVTLVTSISGKERAHCWAKLICCILSVNERKESLCCSWIKCSSSLSLRHTDAFCHPVNMKSNIWFNVQWWCYLYHTPFQTGFFQMQTISYAFFFCPSQSKVFRIISQK